MVKGGGEGGLGTLEQVVVSPTQLRFKLKGIGSYPVTLLTLNGEPATTAPLPRWSSAGTADGYQTISLDTAVPWHKPGASGTLTIQPSPNPGMINSFRNSTAVPGGPWVFTFKVP